MGGEIFLILLAVLVLFGADKMPGIARGIGKGMREFQKAADEIKSELINSTTDIRAEMNNIRSDVQGNISQAGDAIHESHSELKQAVDVKAEINTDRPDESYRVYEDASNNAEPKLKESHPSTETTKTAFLDAGANI